jgi:YD repeat-containing protein
MRWVAYDHGPRRCPNVIAQVDQLKGADQFRYDALNRLVQTDALNHTGTLAYDAAGNAIRTIDPLGFATTFAYDALGRQIRTESPTAPSAA